MDDGEIPIDNNAAEQSMRGFCIVKKNWIMCDTINGAKSSAIIYSLIETAKANKLKIYEYFNYLLTEIPEHMEDTNRDFLKKLPPWSEKFQQNVEDKICHSNERLSYVRVPTMEHLLLYFI